MHSASRTSRSLPSLLALALVCLAASSGASADIFTAADAASPGQAGFQPADSPPGPHTAITPEWTIFTGAPMLSSPKMADLQGDGPKEVILTTYAPGVDPYAYGQVFVLDAEGNDLPGWPIQTPGPIPATAAIGDLDNNGVSEIVVGCWDQMHVFQLDGSEMPGWPKTASVTQAAALEDLDGDGDLEILVPVSSGLYIFQHDGSFFPGWPKFAPDMMGSPALADLDEDPELEIAAGTFQGPVGPDYEVYAWNLDGTVLDGFPVTTSGVNKVPPALGDIDNDGMVEIVIPSYDDSDLDYLYAWDGTGAAEPGWPVRGERIRLSPPALADIDQDGDLEIFTAGADVTTLDGYLYGFDHTGASLPSFPITLNRSQVNSSPVVSNTHGGTGNFEVFVKNKDYFFGYHTDGSSIPDFPFFLSDANHTGTTSPSPCLDDLDGDGDIEAIFAATFNQVAMVDFPDAVDPADLHWPAYKQDPQNRSYFGPGTSSSVPQITADGMTPLRIWPNPASTSVRLAVDTRNVSAVEISILDPSGRRIRSLSGSGTGATWDGRDDNGRAVASGIYTILLRGQEESARRLVWIR
jgi:hypothetical protein